MESNRGHPHRHNLGPRSADAKPPQWATLTAPIRDAERAALGNAVDVAAGRARSAGTAVQLAERGKTARQRRRGALGVPLRPRREPSCASSWASVPWTFTQAAALRSGSPQAGQSRSDRATASFDGATRFWWAQSSPRKCPCPCRCRPSGRRSPTRYACKIRRISATGQASRPLTRIGRSGPFSVDAQARIVCGFRPRW